MLRISGEFKAKYGVVFFSLSVIISEKATCYSNVGHLVGLKRGAMYRIRLASFYDDEAKKIVAVTISDYSKMISAKDKERIASFVYNRLFSRYIRPYSFNCLEYKRKYKNGFSIMASLCLLVETLQSFKNGWGDSDRKSEKAFKEFFSDNPHFKELNGKGSIIYKNIRCGILHQGETTGGWKITREGKRLYDNRTHTLDAVLFAKRMENSLSDYYKGLVTSEWDSEIWDNLRTKMRKIIQHCGG
jgi:hypothetical protein